MNEYIKILSLINGENLSVKDSKKIVDYFINIKDNDDFVNKIAHMKNQNLYLKIIHLIENYIDVLEIENERRKYIIKIINDINDKQVSLKDLREYVIYYFIGDNYYNFLVNFNQMLLYMMHIGKILIPIKHVEFYKMCLNICNLNENEIILFFKQYQDKSKVYEMFYDDIKNIKNDSYNDLVRHSLNLEKGNYLYNKELSYEKGVNVYYLNGEEFYAFVRCIIPNKNVFSKDMIYCNLPKKYYSFSYIGDKNIGTIDKINKSTVTLMYKINPYNIVHVHHTDSSSGLSAWNDIFISNKINEIYSSDSLIRNTKFYNEVVVKKDGFGIIPTAVVCFDKIKDKDLNISFRYNLPIVLINSKKYYLDDGYPDYNDNDTYCL